jgi:hypothetical protein
MAFHDQDAAGFQRQHRRRPQARQSGGIGNVECFDHSGAQSISTPIKRARRALASCPQAGAARAQSKNFFFEKKKQKTFARFARAG